MLHRAIIIAALMIWSFLGVWVWFGVKITEGIYPIEQDSILYNIFLSEEIKSIPIVEPCSKPTYSYSVAETASNFTFETISYESSAATETVVKHVEPALSRLGCFRSYEDKFDISFLCKSGKVYKASISKQREGLCARALITISMKY